MLDGTGMVVLECWYGLHWFHVAESGGARDCHFLLRHLSRHHWADI